MNYVLVHGAHLGAWIWEKVTSLLVHEHHQVLTPTLTGLGDRQHLFSPQLDMNTHIDDVTSSILFSEWNDIILVGHSYAGPVIAGVNERIADKIKKLVFLDSFFPYHAQTILDALPQYREKFQLACQKEGHGWIFRTGANAFERWGVQDRAIRAKYQNKLCDFSIHFLSTPLFLSNKFDTAEKIYIRCTHPSSVKEIMSHAYKEALQQEWCCYDLSANHLAPLTEPEKLTQLLLKL